MAKLGAPSINAHTLLKHENAKLRKALYASTKNSDGKTYIRLAKDLGVSAGRARQLYHNFLFSLRREGYVLLEEEE